MSFHNFQNVLSSDVHVKSVSYGTGKFSGKSYCVIDAIELVWTTLPGTEYVDRMALTSNLVIPKQSIGVASSVSPYAPKFVFLSLTFLQSSGLSGADGILG